MHESEKWKWSQSCPTLSDPMDCSLPGSSIHGIFQARVLEWGAIAFSPNYWTTNSQSNSLNHVHFTCLHTFGFTVFQIESQCHIWKEDHLVQESIFWMKKLRPREENGFTQVLQMVAELPVAPIPWLLSCLMFVPLVSLVSSLFSLCPFCS